MQFNDFFVFTGLSFEGKPLRCFILRALHIEANWFVTETNARISDPRNPINSRNPALAQDLTDWDMCSKWSRGKNHIDFLDHSDHADHQSVGWIKHALNEDFKMFCNTYLTADVMGYIVFWWAKQNGEDKRAFWWWSSWKGIQIIIRTNIRITADFEDDQWKFTIVELYDRFQF